MSASNWIRKPGEPKKIYVSLIAKKKVVESEVRTGVVKVTDDEECDLVGHSPGSGLIVVIYDSEKRVAGMLNSLLPDSKLDRNRANRIPALFLDTGLPMLLAQIRHLGVEESACQLKVVGGANPLFGDDRQFQLGTQNLNVLTSLIKSHGLTITKSYTGQPVHSCRLKLGTGEVKIALSGGEIVTI